MASVKWNPKMSVGVPELDHDHKGLLSVINDLEVHRTGDAEAEVVKRTLNWLLRYAQTHFAREQAVMTSCKYPMLSGHIDEHRDFVSRMQQSIAAFDEMQAEAAAGTRDDLIAYLEKWWIHHIMTEDMQYRRFAEKNLSRSRRAARDVKGYEIWWS